MFVFLVLVVEVVAAAVEVEVVAERNKKEGGRIWVSGAKR